MAMCEEKAKPNRICLLRVNCIPLMGMDCILAVDDPGLMLQRRWRVVGRKVMQVQCTKNACLGGMILSSHECC